MDDLVQELQDRLAERDRRAAGLVRRPGSAKRGPLAGSVPTQPNWARMSRIRNPVAQQGMPDWARLFPKLDDD